MSRRALPSTRVILFAKPCSYVPIHYVRGGVLLKPHSHIPESQPFLTFLGIFHVDYNLSIPPHYSLCYNRVLALPLSRPSSKSYRRSDRCYQCSIGRIRSCEVRFWPYPFSLDSSFSVGSSVLVLKPSLNSTHPPTPYFPQTHYLPLPTSLPNLPLHYHLSSQSPNQSSRIVPLPITTPSVPNPFSPTVVQEIRHP